MATVLIVAVISTTAAVLIEGAPADEARALDARTKALAAEVRAKAEADRRLMDANQVVETFLSAVSDDLNRVQGAQTIRRRLLQQAADYFARVAQERSSDPILEFEALQATYRAGKVRRLLGEIDGSTSPCSEMRFSEATTSCSVQLAPIEHDKCWVTARSSSASA